MTVVTGSNPGRVFIFELPNLYNRWSIEPLLDATNQFESDYKSMKQIGLKKTHMSFIHNTFQKTVSLPKRF
jgi:hypothetical protein